MPSEPLPNKREVMLALLAEASVFIHLDPRGPSVRVPPWFKNQAQLVLQVGLNMAVPIPDLDVSEEGIKCTLSFSRRPFFCSIPWKSVFGLVGEGGPGLVWPDDVPIEVAAQVHAQGQKQAGQKSSAKKADSRDSGRARLRAVSAEGASGDAPTAQTSLPAEGTVAAAPSDTSEQGARETAAKPAAPKPQVAVAAASVVDESQTPTDSKTKDNAEASEEESAGDKPARPSPASKAPGKRELPPYLRVVK